MKKTFKRTYKSFLIVCTMTLFVFNVMPIFGVGADPAPTYYRILIEADEGHTLSLIPGSGGQEDQITIDGQYISLVNEQGNEVGQYSCNANETECYAYSETEDDTFISYSGQVREDQIFSVVSGGHATNGPFNGINDPQQTVFVQVTDYQDEQQPPHEDEGRVEFSGNAWFVWNCGGKICQYKATNLELRKDGTHGVSEEDPYIVNYIRESDVVDTNTGTTTLEIDSLGEGDYFWTWEEDEFFERLAAARLSEEQITEIQSHKENLDTWQDLQNFVRYLENVDYDAKRAFAIDPCGAKNGANSISTNGDRNFRATIYDDSKYEGLVFGVREADYTYFLSSWDPTFINPELDISGTSKNNSAFYDVYLLEQNLKFSLSNRAKTTIKSIKPIDLNPNAVEITKQGDEYTINFNSNFYNKVLFEVEGNDGSKYYFTVNRIVGNQWENRWDEEADELKGGITLLYPDTDSYDDYEIIANITYKNGKTKTVKAPNVITAQDLYHEGEEHMAYVNEWHDGKGLKAASYGIELTNDMASLSFTAIKKGALDSEIYGGTFAGSGEGIEFDNLDRLLNDWYNHGGRD